MRKLPGWYWTILLSLFSLGVGLIAPTFLQSPQSQSIVLEDTDFLQVAQVATATLTPIVVAQAEESATDTTEEAQPEPTNTLLPPPTIEPPTPTPLPSAIPTVTPTQSFIVNVEVEGIQGLPPSASSEIVYTCEVTDDWTLEYTVQNLDTVSSIAAQFDTYANEIVDANCIEDPDVLLLGQVLLVPGETLPVEPDIVCEPYVQLQPFEGAAGIPSTGSIVFNWDGTESPRNLLRLYPPDFDFGSPDPEKWIDYTFDLRQNHTIDLLDIQAGGTWRWQIIPLDMNFVQICPESALYSFHKDQYDPEGDGL